MFQSLRAGNLFYILDKREKPRLRIAQVVSVSSPAPRYGSTTLQGLGMDQVVDVTVHAQEGQSEYKQLPALASVASFGTDGIVVADNRDAMLLEVETMQKTSSAIIDSIDYHQGVLESCDAILQELNPTLQKEKERAEELQQLRDQVNGQGAALARIEALLAKLSEAPKEKNK